MFSVAQNSFQRLPLWFKVLLIGLLVLSLGLRFVNLGHKVYWHDEVYTSLYVTAHTRKELADREFTRKVIPAKQLLQYQQINPQRSLGDVVHVLGVEDTKHPPIYYLLLWAWMQVWGNAPAVTRSFSAVMSLLTLPCWYWFCRELFAETAESKLAMTVAGLAGVLTATSPLYFAYAQEAREYSLWVIEILGSSALLLRAMRLPTLPNWGLYTLSVCLSIYTFPLSGLVTIAHGVYVLLLERFRLSKIVMGYGIAATIGFLSFVPWIIYALSNYEMLHGSTAWIEQSLPLLAMLQHWALNAARIFLDFDWKTEQGWAYLVFLPIILLEAYALYYFCRRTPAKVYLFVLTLVGVMSLSMLLPDFIKGGQRSIITRYLFPIYLGIQLAVAYLAVSHIQAHRTLNAKLWQVGMGALLTLSVVSCGVQVQADTWWHKWNSYYHPAIARTLNPTDRPLLISDPYGVNAANIVSLSYLVDPKVKFLLIPEVGMQPQVVDIPQGYSDVFLLNLPEGYRQQFQQKHNVELVSVQPDLWKVK